MVLPEGLVLRQTLVELILRVERWIDHPSKPAFGWCQLDMDLFQPVCRAQADRNCCRPYCCAARQAVQQGQLQLIGQRTAC